MELQISGLKSTFTFTDLVRERYVFEYVFFFSDWFLACRIFLVLRSYKWEQQLIFRLWDGDLCTSIREIWYFLWDLILFLSDLSNGLRKTRYKNLVCRKFTFCSGYGVFCSRIRDFVIFVCDRLRFGPKCRLIYRYFEFFFSDIWSELFHLFSADDVFLFFFGLNTLDTEQLLFLEF